MSKRTPQGSDRSFLDRLRAGPAATWVGLAIAVVAIVVVVGFLMVMQVSGIDWKNYEIAIPAFLTMVLMPFTYSITAGIGAGFVAYVLIKVVRGKAAAVHPLMWLVAGLFVLYFAIDPIKDVLGV